ncbi:MAG: 4'-phosphopantetheinyl transferase family protein [Planctomycetota bacterium]|jgi:4'-phosphopantetheinyl transferase
MTRTANQHPALDCPLIVDKPATASEVLPLGAAEIHVWFAPLDAVADSADDGEHLLDDEERARADRFRFARHRRRFVARRRILRLVLGRYLGRAPHQLRYVLNRFGKPRLVDQVGPTGLVFSLSHSSELAAIAVGRGCRTGVDIERLRDDLDPDSVAERFFAPAEARLIRAARPGDRHRQCLRCWTRKEALVKAIGVGLTSPTRKLDALTPAVRYQTPGWTILDLDTPSTHVGALAVHPGRYRLRVRRWPADGSTY